MTAIVAAQTTESRHQRLANQLGASPKNEKSSKTAILFSSRLTTVFIHINYLVRNQLKSAFFHDEFILFPKLLNSLEER
jgi:hypothetical protein